MTRWLLGTAAALACLLLAACGARTALDEEVDASVSPRPQARPEQCNGLDDNLDGRVDEDFRDEAGRYVHSDHCGRCEAPCRPDGANVVAVECRVIDERPVCAATQCAAGFAPTRTGGCALAFDRLCLPCAEDGDCGVVESARCLAGHCTAGCESGCPDGYTCSSDGLCIPEGGSCDCEPGQSFMVACALSDPEGLFCAGRSQCDDGVLGPCEPPVEVCDGTDNDCNGIIDDGFRDDRGAYSLDVQHCGECGVDCTRDDLADNDLVCGGDPFAPSCVLHCPDLDDGLQVGDRVDADRDITTGCECTVQALVDEPGPPGAEGEDLDQNCDGADGMVVESFYVAPDGDDASPGSPTRPLATIGEALRRAGESLETASPRAHVFIASGSYPESIEIPDGVKVHGGYRRDFRALDPIGFRVEIRAPADTDAPGGAALVVRGAGQAETLVEWITVRGVDAVAAGAPAFGAVLIDPGPNLVLRDMEVRSGVAGPGSSGQNGAAGSGPTAAASNGSRPRAAVEDENHFCIPGGQNTVSGGTGGTNVCGGTEVSGGAGGSARCPVYGSLQPRGESGSGNGGVAGGGGGEGGMDVRAPIFGFGCEGGVCCGLADYQVPGRYVTAEPGRAGNDGASGQPGGSCTDAMGRFQGGEWRPGTATAGTGAQPGTGGGGGGAGGGVEMTWTSPNCEYVDGLGGGGGGGGAGGCGGRGGRPGTSGGPSVAILVRYTTGGVVLPRIESVEVVPGEGGRGGDGGAGGDGGLGGSGGFGGELSREERATPTLAATTPGGRGGPGGNGGAGGGGGAGCGGGSVGVWLTGTGGTTPPGIDAWRSDNSFTLGRPGTPGRGGGGAAAAPDGVPGGAIDVLVQ